MMSYIDHVKYKTMRDNPDQYFDDFKVVNFDIIHHKCCRDKLIGDYKENKTIKTEDLSRYPKKEAEIVLPAAFRNKKGDLRVKQDLMIKHFRDKFK